MAFALKPGEKVENLDRVVQSQDLPDAKQSGIRYF
jgi:hypothetical protein